MLHPTALYFIARERGVNVVGPKHGVHEWQDNPLMEAIVQQPHTPLLGLDMWEHAY